MSQRARSSKFVEISSSRQFDHFRQPDSRDTDTISNENSKSQEATGNRRKKPAGTYFRSNNVVIDDDDTDDDDVNYDDGDRNGAATVCSGELIVQCFFQIFQELEP